jgi:hypothetical protein
MGRGRKQSIHKMRRKKSQAKKKLRLQKRMKKA